MTQPKHNIPTERANDLLQDGIFLKDVYVDGELKIETDIWEKEVAFENCVIEYFSGSSTSYDKPVRFINCHFKKCQFSFIYFLVGLTIENCSFDNCLDFQAGGYNKVGNPIVIANNNFEGFVNFFDCWFENEIIISNNNFHKGTNLFGKPNNIQVTFDLKPIIKDNTGRLNLDSEE